MFLTACHGTKPSTKSFLNFFIDECLCVHLLLFIILGLVRFLKEVSFAHQGYNILYKFCHIIYIFFLNICLNLIYSRDAEFSGMNFSIITLVFS